MSNKNHARKKKVEWCMWWQCVPPQKWSLASACSAPSRATCHMPEHACKGVPQDQLISAQQCAAAVAICTWGMHIPAHVDAP